MSTAIIGAGIGGLATALAMRKAGVDAVVYEQASTVGEVGAGLCQQLLAFRDAGLMVGIRHVDEGLEGTVRVRYL